MRELRDEIERLEVEVRRIHRAIDEARDANAVAAYMSELRQKVDAAQARVEALKRQIAAAKESLAEKRREKKELESALSRARKEVAAREYLGFPLGREKAEWETRREGPIAGCFSEVVVLLLAGAAVLWRML